jgi:hypothetical protein
MFHAFLIKPYTRYVLLVIYISGEKSQLYPLEMRSDRPMGPSEYIWFGWLVYSCCSHLEHWAFVKRFVLLQFLNLRHLVGLLGRAISPSQGRYPTQTQMSIPRVGFEPTIPALERAKIVHALDRAATVISEYSSEKKNPVTTRNRNPVF